MPEAEPPPTPPACIFPDATRTFSAPASDATARTRALAPRDSNDRPTWILDDPSAATSRRPAEQAPAGPRYRLDEMVGRGGMGEIWAARQLPLHRTGAFKRLRTDHLSGSSHDETSAMVIDFQREAYVAAQLEHPNIVPVHDLGLDDDGHPVLAMKLVHGEPWNHTLARDWKALSRDQHLHKQLATLMDVAQAVDDAHSRRIVHRDLKPSQVMVGSYGEVLLMDWGLDL